MTPQKKQQIATYLAEHRHEYNGFERLNAPPVWRFQVNILPHNNMFDEGFWSEINRQNLSDFTIAEYADGTWHLGF